MVKLTIKQQRFCDEYIRLGEITQAAINAGYSTKTAYNIGKENLDKPSIKAYIDKRLEKLKKSSIAEQDEILQLLTSIARGQASGTGLVGVGGGAQSVEQIPPTLAERTKAAELLGKRYAMWTDKQIIDGVQQVVINNDLKD